MSEVSYARNRSKKQEKSSRRLTFKRRTSCNRRPGNKKLVEDQKAVGIKGITDGEFRRGFWHLDF